MERKFQGALKLILHGAFSYDVIIAMLLSQKNITAAILVSQASLV